MKKIALLICVLALAACGGSNNGAEFNYAPSWTPSSTRKANSVFTKMESFIDRPSSAIARCQEAGLCSNTTSYTRESAASALGLNEKFDKSDEAKLYKQAKKEYTNLLDILNGVKEPTTSELKRAWLLAGRTNKEFSNFSTIEILDMLRNMPMSRIYDIFAGLPLEGDRGSFVVDWDFGHHRIFDDLGDVNFTVGDNDAEFNFRIGYDGKIVGIDIDGESLDKDSDGNTFADGQIEIKGYGNLKFADFGVVKTHTGPMIGTSEEMLFYGGYDESKGKRMDNVMNWYTVAERDAARNEHSHTMEYNDLNFVGKAVGKVEGSSGRAISVTDATFTMNGKTKKWTMDMPFATKGDNKGKFYDVALNGGWFIVDNANMRFYNGDKVDFDWRFNDQNEFNRNPTAMDMRGYGNGVITEVVGYVKYYDGESVGAQQFEAVMGVSKK